MSKAKYITFKCGKWIVQIKQKSISRHSTIEEAIKARDEYISEHHELKLKHAELENDFEVFENT